jgi:hypothetical protein
MTVTPRFGSSEVAWMNTHEGSVMGELGCRPVVGLTLALATLLPVTGFGQSITIDTNNVVNDAFGGLGFQWDLWSVATADLSQTAGYSYPVVSDAEVTNIFAKRWTELNPGLVRCQLGTEWWEYVESQKTWNSESMKSLYRVLDICQTTNTDVYMSTWMWSVYHQPWLVGGTGGVDFSVLDVAKWARTHVDLFDHLINVKGYHNIKWWGNTNEMADSSDDRTVSFLELKSVAQAFKDELSARGLPGLLGFLATDQSWNYKYSQYSSIQWAIDNMDQLVDIYGGHTYPNGLTYDAAKQRLDTGVGYARAKGKGFLVGEFGDQSVDKSAADYGRRLCEIAIWGLNAGVHGMAQWVFAGSRYDAGSAEIDLWGLFADKDSGFAIRPAYYAYGLMTKFFRPGSAIYFTTGESGIIGAGAKDAAGRWSIAVVNNNSSAKNVSLSILGAAPNLQLRYYVYDPANPPGYDNGNLQAAVATVAVVNGGSQVSVPAKGVVVLTNQNAYTGRDPVVNSPAPPTGLRVN